MVDVLDVVEVDVVWLVVVLVGVLLVAVGGVVVLTGDDVPVLAVVVVGAGLVGLVVDVLPVVVVLPVEDVLAEVVGTPAELVFVTGVAVVLVVDTGLFVVDVDVLPPDVVIGLELTVGTVVVVGAAVATVPEVVVVVGTGVVTGAVVPVVVDELVDPVGVTVTELLTVGDPATSVTGAVVGATVLVVGTDTVVSPAGVLTVVEAVDTGAGIGELVDAGGVVVPIAGLAVPEEEFVVSGAVGDVVLPAVGAAPFASLVAAGVVGLDEVADGVGVGALSPDSFVAGATAGAATESLLFAAVDELVVGVFVGVLATAGDGEAAVALPVPVVGCAVGCAVPVVDVATEPPFAGIFTTPTCAPLAV